jgi:hypothetical protein
MRSMKSPSSVCLRTNRCPTVTIETSLNYHIVAVDARQNALDYQ